MNKLNQPTAAEILSVANKVFTGEFEPIRKAFNVAANYYAPSLEMNVVDILRAKYVQQLVFMHGDEKTRDSFTLAENNAAEGMLETVVNMAINSAYREFYNFLEFVCRGKLDIGLIPETYLPMTKFFEAFDVSPYAEQ